MHFKIIIEDDGGHKIDGKQLRVDDIQSLLQHYEHNRIDPALRSIGKAYTEDEYRRRKTEDEHKRMQDKKNEEEQRRMQDNRCFIL
jgi:hypothetical protein